MREIMDYLLDIKGRPFGLCLRTNLGGLTPSEFSYQIFKIQMKKSNNGSLILHLDNKVQHLKDA